MTRMTRMTRLPRLLPPALRLGAALAIALAAALPALPAPAAAAELTTAASPLSGRFRYVGSAAQQSAAIDAAIDAAIANFPPAIQEVARRRLKEATAIPSAVVLEIGDAARKVSLDARTITTRPGKAATWSAGGMISRVTHEVGDTALTERLVTVEGDRQNVYTLADDGRAMTLAVTIRSAHLAAPIRYTLRYARE